MRLRPPRQPQEVTGGPYHQKTDDATLPDEHQELGGRHGGDLQDVDDHEVGSGVDSAELGEPPLPGPLEVLVLVTGEEVQGPGAQGRQVDQVVGQ